MDKMRVVGGKALRGTVRTSGAKNSALKLLFATLLAEGKHTFHNVPKLMDVDSSAKLLESLGAIVKRSGHTVTVEVKPPGSFEANYELVRQKQPGAKFCRQCARAFCVSARC